MFLLKQLEVSRMGKGSGGGSKSGGSNKGSGGSSPKGGSGKGPAGFPSKTGNPSGGGRDNNPPSSPKK